MIHNLEIYLRKSNKLLYVGDYTVNPPLPEGVEYVRVSERLKPLTLFDKPSIMIKALKTKGFNIESGTYVIVEDSSDLKKYFNVDY